MSKASEWANAPKPVRPAFSMGIASKAYVDDDGHLFVQGVFEPSQAEPLARWILDTFSDGA